MPTRKRRPSFRISARLTQRIDADRRAVREIISGYPPLSESDLCHYRRGQTFGPKRRALIETLAAVEYGIDVGAVVVVEATA